MKKNTKENKILKRILPIICAVLCLATALTTPISAIVDSSQGIGTNYDLTARSPYPMTVGLAFDTSDKNVVFATDIGGFGQEYNTTLNGTDSFCWTSEASTLEELDGALTYQFLDERKQDKEYKNLLEPLGSDGYGLASYRPIKISAQSGTDLTQGLDCSSIVYRLRDVVINSSVIRKGNYTSNVHMYASQEAINDDNIYSPNVDDYRYLVPHVVIPSISETSGYLGTYNVVASITDEWGNVWDLNYSIPIDSRGATSDTFVPFLPMSIFDSYGKSFGDQAYNIGMSNTVVLNDYYGYLDVDYYQYQNVIPDFNLIVNLRAEVGGEDTLISREYLPLGEYVGQTFNEWISSVDGQNGYTVTGGVGGITITYTDTENDFTYSGTITNSQGTNVYGSSIITTDEEYTANLQREEATTDELAGTWILNTSLTLPSSNISLDTSLEGTMYMYSYDNTLYEGVIGSFSLRNDVSFMVFQLQATNVPSSQFYSNKTSGDIKCYNDMDDIVTVSPSSTDGQLLRTFTITSKLSEVTNGSTLLAWLKANATKQGASTVAVADEPTPASTDTPTTTATGTWNEVERTESAELVLWYPLIDTSGIIINDSEAYQRWYDNYSMPNMSKYVNTFGVEPPEMTFDFTSWIGTAVGGFLNMELMPNFSIGGVLAILIAFSIVMLFLKFFAGG